MQTEHPAAPRPLSPSRPHPSRARAWAARLALLVASVASVATSMSGPPPVVVESEPGVLSLSPTSPTARVALPVRMFVPNGSKQTVWATMRAPLFVKWTPDAPGDEAQPIVKAKLVFGPRPVKEISSAPVTAGDAGAVRFEALSDGDVCQLEQPCEWEAALELSLQDATLQGTVDVEWRMVVEVSIDDTEDSAPDGFEVLVGPR
ncbi:hypothetical protein HUA78_42105 [Myxococcus sp. CA033]|uniref:hypothetical protein n=1 Tax=Myxococcus sp. CA033 TaxID=2741516 RepID=UPI00157A6944|nr:hypothetical protein [Myxococcus sp. CA033]NTX41043.1 hypothetical protein [Myxococcus sp. CA033]